MRERAREFVHSPDERRRPLRVPAHRLAGGRQNSSLRRADRLAVLADVIGDAGRAAVETARGAAHSHQVVIARLRLRVRARRITGGPSATRALVEFLLRCDFGPSDFTEIEAAVQKALAEVSARLGQV